MSNVRIKIFSFDSTVSFPKDMEFVVNNFLSDPNIIAEPENINFIPDAFTTISITYKLRKGANKKKKENGKSGNTK